MDIDRYSSRGLECICGNLRMASRAVTSVYDSHLREAGLQASQMAVLWAVAGMPGSGIKDIAKRIAMDETALLRNLRVLEGRGWIAIDVGTDRRQRLPAPPQAAKCSGALCRCGSSPRIKWPPSSRATSNRSTASC